MKRNEKGVPVMESDHEHGTLLLGNYHTNGLIQLDEICACAAETIQMHGALLPGQYFTVIPMPMEIH